MGLHVAQDDAHALQLSVFPDLLQSGQITLRISHATLLLTLRGLLFGLSHCDLQLFGACYCEK